MSTIETTVAAYGAAMRRERRSPKGIRRYMDCLRHLVEWDGGRDVREITKADLSAFEAWWWDDFEARNGREPAEATVAAMQVAVIQYFGYLEQEELIERNPARLIKKIKRTQRRNDWLRPDEDRAMLAAPKNLRERFVVSWLRHTGMRITEAVSVTNADVDMRDWTITVRKSKTDAGVRTIPVLPELRPVLEEWRQFQLTRGLHEPHTPVLATRTGRPMDKWQVLCVVKRVAVALTSGSTPSRWAPRWPAAGTPCRRPRRSPPTPCAGRSAPTSSTAVHGSRWSPKLLGHANTTVTERPMRSCSRRPSPEMFSRSSVAPVARSSRRRPRRSRWR